MLTPRAFAYLSKVLARSSDTLPKIAIPLSCCHADMSELGSELTEQLPKTMSAWPRGTKNPEADRDSRLIRHSGEGRNPGFSTP
jgi:hypothetical protein